MVSYGHAVIAIFVPKCFVQNVKRAVETIKTVKELIFSNVERWCTVNVRVAVQSNQAILGVGLLVLHKGFVSSMVL